MLVDLLVFNSSEKQDFCFGPQFLNFNTFKHFSSSAKKEPFRRLNRHAFPELYDVTIKCANDMEIKAHKCVLVARLEYFSLMFSHSWSEVSIENIF